MVPGCECGVHNMEWMSRPVSQSLGHDVGMLEDADSYWDAMWDRRGDLSVALWVSV